MVPATRFVHLTSHGVGTVDNLDIFSGTIFGVDPRLTSRERDDDPLSALAGSLVEALSQPPCLVAFSGGRDSSVLLSAAVDVAGRHGFEAPIPLTLRFPHDPTSHEDDYQRLMVERLGLTEWEIVEPGDALDVIGEFATDLGVRHGPLVPFNAHFVGFMLRHASRGALVTGFGGDEVMTPHPLNQVASVLTGQEGPTMSLLRFYGASRLPHRAGRFKSSFRQPWLTDSGLQEQNARLISEVRQWRLHAGHHLWYVSSRRRLLGLAVDCMERIAGGFGVSLHHPFLDDRVVGALANRRGLASLPTRTGLTLEAFGGLLPTELVERNSKASFPEGFWTDTARQTWRNLPLDGLDHELVDIGQLTAEWAKRHPTPNTYMAAQHLARLAAAPHSASQ